MNRQNTDIAIIGAGIAGISTAYYLREYCPHLRITLIDAGQPMAFTSAQSGENYRNWWPHPVMTAFTDYSISLMEQIARDTGNRLQMTRRGYVLATRLDNIDALINELYTGYGEQAEALIRIHNTADKDYYQPAISADWTTAPSGVDVLQNTALIRAHFPYFDPAISTVLHIRRAGDISAQQLGQYMLEKTAQSGLQRITGTVTGIENRQGRGFAIEINTAQSGVKLVADQMVNAAGPFINEIATMLDAKTALPVQNILQQKIAFPDHESAVSRAMPFAIDLDSQRLDWNEEDRSVLQDSPELNWLAGEMPGGIHCRPDGGEQGNWIKLGWAYNARPEDKKIQWQPQLDEHFPEIVLRGAARLNPALKVYYGCLPRRMSHYGGYYTMTRENWPLIGPTAVPGVYINGVLSGFGSMAACAAGSICALHIAHKKQALPAYADDLGLARYDKPELMEKLTNPRSRGIL